MKRHTLLTLLLATASQLALAQPAPPPPPDGGRPPGLERLDANGDGDIDKTEAAAAPRLAERFDSIDTNKDGKLSRAELEAGRPRRGEGPPPR